jgi:nucleotide-binding universal stress UspA family protein
MSWYIIFLNKKMKTVFIATDFSVAAENATKYGIAMASDLGLKIVLFNAYQVPLSIPESFTIVRPEEVKSTAEGCLKEAAMAYKKSSLQPIEILAVEGYPTDSIVRNAKKYDDSIIITGMKGEGTTIRKVFGSTVLSLVRKSKMPMLVVPEKAEYKPVKNMALAAEVDPKLNLSCINPLVQICEKFHSKVYVVRVLKTHSDIIDELIYRSERVSKKLAQFNLEYKFPRADNVTFALEEFIATHNIDMLGVIPQHHNILERVFIKSETKELAFYTRVPMLLMPEMKIGETVEENRMEEKV